ncbi:iron ABC transporter ATPase [Mycolicibacterium wolinskyi]|uniref:Trehalose import ATP-binding protein SugC n=1 Tax=Mycolicibacterium wolinskyi TaxID=59750 RepID=A0A132PCT4_9MYCO|nr:ABC transporter ATP-binding protein [Mycolicibacterium wolinskyi]KWX20151.1 iron ABC transporter ATPase [Mycolicibacterium wolinskyi]
MLEITNLVKTFDGDKQPNTKDAARVRAIDDVSIHVKEGELFTLLGPSGCGKTTTLRSVAGLERPDSGTIKVADRVMFNSTGAKAFHMPTNERGLGMVFQSYAIWPHMKVFDNVAFPLQVLPRRKRPSKKTIAEKVERVLATMELAHLAGRQATKLSGGQQQRLALARALVTEPPLLLLDEPLSNLDAKLRESLRFELKRLQHDLGITSIYVTHDQIEALALSSRIAVMRSGKIMQLAPPRDIYERPANRFVAEFIGTSNFVNGTVTGREDNHLVVETGHGRLMVASELSIGIGESVILAARPEAVTLIDEPPTVSGPNQLTGSIVTRSFLGDAVDHIVRVGDQDIRARCEPSVSYAPETKVTLHVAPASLTLVPIGD